MKESNPFQIYGDLETVTLNQVSIRYNLTRLVFISPIAPLIEIPLPDFSNKNLTILTDPPAKGPPLPHSRPMDPRKNWVQFFKHQLLIDYWIEYFREFKISRQWSEAVITHAIDHHSWQFSETEAEPQIRSPDSGLTHSNSFANCSLLFFCSVRWLPILRLLFDAKLLICVYRKSFYRMEELLINIWRNKYLN